MDQVPYADMIRAVLDGKQVQTRTADGQGWSDMDGTAAMRVSYILNYPSLAQDGGPRYRVKPVPVVLWGIVNGHGDIGGFGDEYTARRAAKNYTATKYVVLRVELDPDTLKVLDARTEMP